MRRKCGKSGNAEEDYKVAKRAVKDDSIVPIEKGKISYDKRLKITKTKSKGKRKHKGKKMVG